MAGFTAHLPGLITFKKNLFQTLYQTCFPSTGPTKKSQRVQAMGPALMLIPDLHKFLHKNVMNAWYLSDKACHNFVNTANSLKFKISTSYLKGQWVNFKPTITTCLGFLKTK